MRLFGWSPAEEARSMAAAVAAAVYGSWRDPRARSRQLGWADGTRSIHRNRRQPRRGPWRWKKRCFPNRNCFYWSFFLEVTMLSEWESKSGRWWRQVLVLGPECWWENRDRNGQEQWQWALVNCSGCRYRAVSASGWGPGLDGWRDSRVQDGSWSP